MFETSFKRSKYNLNQEEEEEGNVTDSRRFFLINAYSDRLRCIECVHCTETGHYKLRVGYRKKFLRICDIFFFFLIMMIRTIDEEILSILILIRVI